MFSHYLTWPSQQLWKMGIISVSIIENKDSDVLSYVSRCYIISKHWQWGQTQFHQTVKPTLFHKNLLPESTLLDRKQWVGYLLSNNHVNTVGDTKEKGSMSLAIELIYNRFENQELWYNKKVFNIQPHFICKCIWS